MPTARRLARGLRRAAPTAALTILWFGLGAAGFMLFFQDVREPTFPLILFLMLFGVGVWIPYFRFFFLVAEEVVLPQHSPTRVHGVVVGLTVALVSIPPILLITGTDHAELIKVLVWGPASLALVGVGRVHRMQRVASDT